MLAGGPADLSEQTDQSVKLPVFFLRKSLNRQNSRSRTGNIGEELAVRYLKQQGYAIVERNYRRRIGEIDVIARDGDSLVFVEVKTRRSSRQGSPLEAVDIRKQQQVSRVALVYMSEKRCGDVMVRFDVVGVHIEGKSARFELIKNAFEYCG